MVSLNLSADEEDLKYVLFSDSLVTVSDTGKELGEFAVTVETATHQGQECFLIHANSHGAIDSVPCGTSITAYITWGMETLEQQHHEYVKVCNWLVRCHTQSQNPQMCKAIDKRIFDF